MPRRPWSPSEVVTVLVVEDSPDQSALLSQYLQRGGCRVVAVDTAEKAIAAYADTDFHLAVVDLVLPGMGGSDFILRLRDDFPETKVVVTSVLDAKDFPAADGILPKPFTGAQVRQMLEDTVMGGRF
jgi:CheY-like chemotaxis protein